MSRIPSFRRFGLIAVILLVVGLRLPVHANPDTPVLTGTETRITADPGDQYDPSISGNLVVFTDERGSDTDVYDYDISKGQELPVVVAPNNQELTDVSGNRIVYTDYRTADIIVYQVDTGQSINLTEADKAAVGHPFNAVDPSIDGNLVAWEDTRDGNMEIYARDMLTNEERRVTNFPEVDEKPAVGNGVIVWQHCQIGGVCSVYAYDWATSVTRQIQSNPGCNFWHVGTDGGRVVYDSNCGNAPDDSDLYLFDLATGAERHLALPGAQTDAHISGDFVSFDDLSSGLYHVKLWHTPTNTVFDLPFPAGTGQYLSNIDGNRIVYTDDRHGDLDVYMYTFQVQIPLTPPVASPAQAPAANAAGWNNSDVTVSWNWKDSGAGIDPNNCTTTSTSTGEGTMTLNATCTDLAGNTGTAAYAVSVDKTAPMVTVTGVTDGAVYTLGAVPAASCSTSDALSGVATNAALAISGGNASQVGMFSAACTGAMDNAGNPGSATVTYQVIYRFDGFLQPINDTARPETCGTPCATSIFIGGSTVPARFRLRDAAGNVVQAASPPLWLTPQQGAPLSGRIDERFFLRPGSSGTTYDLFLRLYYFNWKTTRSAAGFYWRIGVTLDDGQTYTVDIGLR